MNSLRLWILVLSVTCFCAGGAAGALVAARATRPAAEPGAFADYERDVVRAFALSPERARILHTVLASYQREIEQIKDLHLAETMTAMEPELSERGRWYRDLIRDKVLPPERRPEFDGPAFLAVWDPAR